MVYQQTGTSQMSHQIIDLIDAAIFLSPVLLAAILVARLTLRIGH